MRRIASAVRRLTRTERPIVLMYHRVAEIGVDPWQLAVSPKRFAEQLAALTEDREVVPLAWLVAKLRSGLTPRRTVALTFDDGYADVLLDGKPLLEQHGCPATVFLTTGVIKGEGAFWWDVLARIILETPSLPERLTLEIAGRRHRWDLAPPSPSDGSRMPVSRSDLHLAVWQELRGLDPGAREEQLAVLAAWANTDARSRPRDRSLTPDEVRRLSIPGFIDIGAHTVTHPSLPLLAAEDKRREIAESSRDCEELIGKPVEGFAYPFGDVDADSVRAVRDAAVRFACTTQPGVVAAAGDPFQLPRILAADWHADEFRCEVLRFV